MKGLNLKFNYLHIRLIFLLNIGLSIKQVTLTKFVRLFFLFYKLKMINNIKYYHFFLFDLQFC